MARRLQSSCIVKDRLLLTAVLASSVATGCASPPAGPTVLDVDHAESTETPVFAASAVNVDQRFSDAVDVKDGSLVIPTSMADHIDVGAIVAGDRARQGSKNPYGFLRRVTAVEAHGSETTLVTSPATLSDWLKSGRIDFRSRRSLFTGAAAKDTGVATKTLKLQGDGQTTGGPASATLATDVEHTLALSNASVSLAGTVTVQASFDGFFDTQSEKGTAFKALLTLDPSFAAEITWAVSKSASGESSWKAAEAVIPIAAPIPITLRYSPELICNVSASGDGSFVVAANLGAHAVVGFEGSASLDHADTTNLSREPTLSGSFAAKSLHGKATVATGCEIVLNPEVLVFDAAGLAGRIGPYANLTATACANANAGGADAAFTLVEEHGVTESFTARLQIPVLGIGKDFSLWSGKQSFGGPTYLAGDANSCNAPSVDSCAGKTDGFHCSEVNAFSGIVCQNGQILKGLQCAATSLSCKSGDESAIQCE